MSGDLNALVGILTQNVQTLQESYAQKGASFPSLDDLYKSGPLDNDPELAATTQLIVAAAFQIIAAVRTPRDTIQDYAPAMHLSAALGLIDEADVADAIKEGGAQGLHVKAISTKTGVDSATLARVLRYLASRHVFREISPDVYANNRISSFLIKSKPIEELKKNKLTRYEDAPAAAFVGHITDESFKGAAHLTKYVRERPKGTNTPWNLASGKKSSIWQWFKEPDNVWRYHRFTAAMKGGADRFPPSVFTGGFDWKSLAPGSVVVDVGGSVGKVTWFLYQAFPHLKFIVQDLPPVVKDAQTFWAEVAPKAVENGRVALQAQDFFQSQSVKDAAIYFMRFIVHDWADEPNTTILKNLRAAAAPTTRLVIFDGVMPHVCSVPGGPPAPPAPLLGNLGAGLGAFITMLDLQMLTILNGKERTFEEFVALGSASGWKLEGAKPGPVTAFIFAPM
ncbi:S-adenosyl-L-methionine-dependent methyltransferase [Gloeopeniophorella convolvens]|nr:S-adenosyl-L-methionine-dependent methyltransferase [Gloeopeniophorella convolvens]